MVLRSILVNCRKGTADADFVHIQVACGCVTHLQGFLYRDAGVLRPHDCQGCQHTQHASCRPPPSFCKPGQVRDAPGLAGCPADLLCWPAASRSRSNADLHQHGQLRQAAQAPGSDGRRAVQRHGTDCVASHGLYVRTDASRVQHKRRRTIEVAVHKAGRIIVHVHGQHSTACTTSL